MNTQVLIDAYVADVLRHLPRGERNEVGVELRGLLGDMLAERGEHAGQAELVAALQAFGSPEEVAARYHPPGLVIIPAAQTRSFTRWALVGLVLQWALTLPRVVQGEQPLVAWWFSWGLGALWWPGFLVMASLVAAWLRGGRAAQGRWRPRVGGELARADRTTLGFAIAGVVIGAAFMTALPWLVGQLPAHLAARFAFAPGFLAGRAWPALLLWLAQLALLGWVFAQRRWTPRARGIDLAISLAWLVLLGSWLLAGPMFAVAPVDEGARGGIMLVMAFIAAELAWRAYRRPRRLRAPPAAAH